MVNKFEIQPRPRPIFMTPQARAESGIWGPGQSLVKLKFADHDGFGILNF